MLAGLFVDGDQTVLRLKFGILMGGICVVLAVVFALINRWNNRRQR